VARIGPVEYVIIGFPGDEFNGDIAPAIAELIEAGTIRLLDLVFVRKDRNGDLSMFEFDAFHLAGTGFAELEGEAGGVMSDEDVIIATEVLDPNTSAVLIVWEHLWAAKTAAAVQRAGGEIIAGERIPARVVENVMAELASV
jgi:hypothetical protein